MKVTTTESLQVGWESSVEESITKIIIYSESNIDINQQFNAWRQRQIQ